jgi:hypothetical protein
LNPNVAAKSIVPFNNSIPYMSQLLKYYESDDNIYLLTDYYPLGSLYLYLELFYDDPEHFLEDLLSNKIIASAIILDETSDGKLTERQESVPASKSLDNSRMQMLSSRRRRSSVSFRLNSSFTSLTSLRAATVVQYAPIKRRTVSTAIGDLKQIVNFKNDFKLAEVEIDNVNINDDTFGSVAMSPSSSSSNSSSSTCLDSNDTKEEKLRNGRGNKNVDFTQSLTINAMPKNLSKSNNATVSSPPVSKSTDLPSNESKEEKVAAALSPSKTNNQWKRTLKVKEWLAQIFCCLSGLHRIGIICKDLSPHNLLLSAKGQVVLTYMSKWNLVDERIEGDLASDFYIAPGLKFAKFEFELL